MALFLYRSTRSIAESLQQESDEATLNLISDVTESVLETANSLTYGLIDDGDSPYSISGTDCVLGVDVSSNPVTVVLPLANSVDAGTQYIIKDLNGNAATNNITINRSGSDTIDGATSLSLELNYDSTTLTSDGVSKWLISGIK